MDKELVLIVLSGALSVVGFIGAFSINRLAKAIDGLVSSDKALQTQLTNYREDMIKNYVHHDSLTSHKHEQRQALTDIRQDVLNRMDKMEVAFKEALYAHEHREMTAMRNQQNAANKSVPQ